MKQEVVLSGAGMDLVTAPDKLPAGRVVDCVNFRGSTVGMAASRPGVRAITKDRLGDDVTLLYRSDNNRYAVSGSTLRYGADLDSAIYTGLSPTGCGIVSYSGYCWLMNRSAQLRLEGPRVYNMGIYPPAHAPRVVLGQQQATLIAEFDLGENWDVYLVSGGILRRNPERREIYYSSGTVSITEGSKDIVGVGTSWSDSLEYLFLRIYDTDGQTVLYESVVADVKSDTLLEAAHVCGHTKSGLRYEIYDWVSNSTYDESNKLSGTHSLRVDLNPPGSYCIERTFSTGVDCRVAGEASDTDYMRLRFYADKPSSIEQISITLVDGESRYAMAIIDGSLLNQSMFSWSYLRIPRAMDEKAIFGSNLEFSSLSEARTKAIESGDTERAENLARQMNSLYQRLMALTPSFSARMGVEELGQVINFDWGNVVRVRVTVNCRDACTIHLDRMEFVGGKRAPLEGEYRYYVTFENALGHESAPSPASEPVVVSNEPVTLELVPTSPDPQVVRRRIYRTGGTLSRPTRVGTIWDNSSTSFEDMTSDYEAQIDGISFAEDADPPPAGTGIAGPFFGRLVAWGVLGHVGRLYWSKTAQPWAWPGSSDEFAGNWVDVGGDDDPIMAVTVHSNTLRIYKKRSVWRIVGDPDSNDPELVLSGLGAVGPMAVAAGPGYDYFVSGTGVYRFNGDTAVPVSNQIEPIFSGRWVSVHPDIPAIPPILPEYLHQTVAEYHHGELRVCGRSVAGGQEIGVCLLYNEAKGEWYREQYPGGKPITALSFEDYGADRGLLLATDQQVFAPRWYLRADSSSGSPESPIHVSMLLRMFQQPPGTRAVWQDLELDYEGRGVVVKALYDGAAAATIGMLNRGGWRRTDRFALAPGFGVSSPLLGILLEGDITEPFVIFGLRLGLILEPGVEPFFDSLPIDLGGAHILEAIEIEYVSQGQVSLEVYSDLPDREVRQRATYQLPPADRQSTKVVTIDWQNTLIEGSVFRFRAASETGIQVLKFKITVKPYSLFLCPGEVWHAPFL